MEQQEMKAQFDAWVSGWPNHCQNCRGTGELHWYENGAPWGAGNWPMPMAEPCDCVINGKCARCGKPDTIDPETGQGPCSNCGWNYDDECPPEFFDGPCYCEYEETNTRMSHLF